MNALCQKEGLKNVTIINTCAVTAVAVKKAKKTIRRAFRENPSQKIIVTGCAAQIKPQTFSSMDEVDFVIGNEDKLSAETWKSLNTKEFRNNRRREVEVSVSDIMDVKTMNPPRITRLARRTRAYVQIQNGCDHRCTFCIIPLGRGNSRSLTAEKVVEQILELVNDGVKEIVLTGVDLTAWGNDLPLKPKLGSLLKKILLKVPSLHRLRLSSIDSAEIDDELFDIIVNEERFMPHLHLSLQSGDNMILKRMKRRHSREQVINFCRTIRYLRPEVTFGADIIVGFPTETDFMFNNSVSLISDCNLTWLHVFPFSARSGTPASKMPAVEASKIKKRAEKLRKIGRRNVTKYLDTQLGKELEVLIEGNGKGRTETYAEVIVEPSLVAGEIKNLIAYRHTGSKLICY